VSRKRAVEHNDEAVELAAPLTAEQRQELYALRFRGAWPSTRAQAEAVLHRLRPAPTGEDQGRSAPVERAT